MNDPKKLMNNSKYHSSNTDFIHGKTCSKADYDGAGGYLHLESDDGRYDVDGVAYCGRCHRAIDF